MSAPIPGITPDNVGIRVQDGSITVTVAKGSRTVAHGDAAPNEGDGKGTYHVEESSTGKVSRTVPLPEDADATAVSAELNGDTLVMHVPKQK